MTSEKGVSQDRAGCNELDRSNFRESDLGFMQSHGDRVTSDTRLLGRSLFLEKHIDKLTWVWDRRSQGQGLEEGQEQHQVSLQRQLTGI